MPLETATYITDLVTTNPAHTDQVNQGDAHIKLIKGALKSTFPNFTSAALNSTQAQIDSLVTGIATSHGVYRGSGLIAVGQYADFPKVPSRFTNAGTAAGGQASIDWIECDGSVYNFTDYPDLAAFLGSTYGGNGTTTFAVPNLTDTGRFRRSRTGSNTVGTRQGNQNLAHSHTVTGSGSTDFQGSHNHNATVSDPGHSHTYTGLAVGSGNATLASGNANNTGLNTSTSVTGISVAIDTQGSHQHNVSITGTAATAGASEARPENIAVIVCLKT